MSKLPGLVGASRCLRSLVLAELVRLAPGSEPAVCVIRLGAAGMRASRRAFAIS